MTNLGVVFPGQGSQSVGMLADVAAEYPEVVQTYAEASEALGFDLWKLTLEGSEATLGQTEHTQPALLAGGVAIWRILSPRLPALSQALLAGHSLGEYTALVIANALSFQDAVRLVAARGRFMQAAVPAGVGSMAAIIGLDEAAVMALCQEVVEAGEVLSPANYNSVGQVVIAGHAAAVERAMAQAKSKGAKMAVAIPVSVPSHCDLMRPAALQLSELLAKTTVQAPTQRVMGNADVQWLTSPDAIRDALVRQLFSPVRWVETLQAFQQAGVTEVIECGPGKVLTGLIKRIDKNLKLSSTADVASVKTLIETSVGAL